MNYSKSMSFKINKQYLKSISGLIYYVTPLGAVLPDRTKLYEYHFNRTSRKNILEAYRFQCFVFKQDKLFQTKTRSIRPIMII